MNGETQWMLYCEANTDDEYAHAHAHTHTHTHTTLAQDDRLNRRATIITLQVDIRHTSSSLAISFC